MRAFVREFGIAYPIIRDGAGDLAALYGIEGTPTTVFIDRAGRVSAVEVGTMEMRAIRKRLEDLLR